MRLAFDDDLCGAPVADVEDVAAGIFGSGGDEDVAAARTDRGLQGLDQVGQVGDRLVFDGAGLILQRVVVGHLRDWQRSGRVECLRVAADGGAFDFQRHANRAQKVALVALVGDVARRFQAAGFRLGSDIELTRSASVRSPLL